VLAHQHAADAKKGGSEDDAIGRSRDGLSTKISIPPTPSVRFILTAVADICQAEISTFSFENLLPDKGYESDRPRVSIADEHANAVSSNRSTPVIYL
jgi:hypothetical protein